MVADEAQFQQPQTQAHITPIIRQITQLSIQDSGITMPHSVEPQDIVLASRPKEAGKQGKAVQLVTNFFKANFQKVPPILHHDMRVERMQFDPETGQASVVRDDGGKLGRPIPPKAISDCVHAWLKQHEATVGPWAYDSRNNLYATKTLVDSKQINKEKYQEFTVELPNEGRKFPSRFQLRVKMVARVTMEELVAYLQNRVPEWPARQLQALEIILNSPFINDPRLLYQSRTLFELAQKATTVGNGGEAWIGYKQDLRPCQYGLMLSIEPSFSVFFEGKNVVDYAQAVLTKDERRPWEWTNDYLLDNEAREVGKELKGLLVMGKYAKSGRETTFTATGLSKEGANRYMFTFKDKKAGTEKEMSVAQYFAKILGINLQFPALQCVTGRGRGPKDTIAVPMELLTIKRGQKRRGLLIGDQQANLVRKAAQRPEDKRNDITAWVHKATTMMGKVEQGFGLKVEKTPATVPGRLLPAPVIQYGAPQHYYAGTTGAWNMKDFKMLQPVTIRCWAVFVLRNPSDLQHSGPGSLDAFLRCVVQGFTAMGMKMPAQPDLVDKVGDMGRYPEQGRLDQAVTNAMKKLQAKNKRLDVAFFIIPRKDPTIYKVIKREMDSAKGVISQVIVAGKASGLGRAGEQTPHNSQLQYVANVGLKVNHKLGGANMRIRGLGDSVQAAPPIWSTKPTMLLGIDVSHPQSFDSSEPSIAGIVASMDKNLAQYACRIKRIGYREEIVTGMQEDIMDLLRLFRERNGVKPESIVIYRDGISQGEFKEVLAKEYTAIRNAGLALEDGYTPPITYITVLKRHRARLFPTAPDADDGGGNVRPGVCVDVGISLASGFDFYLSSHKGIQGTVKPAHYHVLHDENAFGSDAIQIATYWLCYGFCRCTRSVSYCPPAYYAHLVADRGRVLLDRDNISEDFGRSGKQSAPSTSSGSDARAARMHMPNEHILNRMYFV